MRKLVLVLTLVAALTLSGCVQPKSEEEQQEDLLETPVKLGVIGPLTGDYSFYGSHVQNGAQLAVDEINAAGGVLGRELELFAYDSQGDPTLGVNAYNRLVVEDEIDALIGGTFSGVTLAIKELSIEDNLPVLTPTATNPLVTEDAANVFRACYTDSYQGEVAAVFADETLGATKVAVLYNRDDAYSEGLATAFIAEFASRGTVVEELSFGAADDDYSSLLTTIKNSDAEAVFLPGYVAEVGAILSQASDLGLDVPFIGGDGWDGIEENYATVAEGHYFGNHYAKTDPAENVQAFITNFEAEYGESPSALAALAYDAVYAMVEAMEAAGSTDADLVIEALADLAYTEAITGAISFDAQGDPIKAVTMIQVVNGEHVVIEKVEVD